MMESETSTAFVPEINLDVGTEQELSEQLYKSLTTVGFACLKTSELWIESDRYAKKVGSFFRLPIDAKMAFERPVDRYSGYVAHACESLNPKRPGDYKEGYNVIYTPQEGAIPAELFPDEALHLWKTFTSVSHKLCRLIGIAFKLKDVEYLNTVSHCDDPTINPTAMRINYYPALLADGEDISTLQLVKDQVRCGEHSDFGSITLLYTQSPGLEVFNKTTGEYVAAGQKSGAIYVNIGDALQYWSDDILLATKHRVMMPTQEDYLRSDRISIALFCCPDNNTVIQSLLGSNKYPPITYADFLKSRMNAVYQ